MGGKARFELRVASLVVVHRLRVASHASRLPTRELQTASKTKVVQLGPAKVDYAVGKPSFAHRVLNALSRTNSVIVWEPVTIPRPVA